ncbi:hypothetical protein KY49_1304 [Burkholderia sp. MSHR3999]|nr:hypothetical protein BW23_5306 [Burkholderia ubonensis MSMB22]KIP13083.1 hypothetical protein KY49_1304 [Burkholderia sp. MSHR3999]
MKVTFIALALAVPARMGSATKVKVRLTKDIR